MEQPFIRHDAVNRLRFADPANLLHLNALPVKSLEAWQKSELLEQSPETLFHIGQVVGSCQSITGSMMGLNSGLVSYLAVGHFGVLTDTEGTDACVEMPSEPTCTLLRGRAVVRLLLADDNSAALLLEKTYFNPKQSQSERDQVRARLLKKAQQLSDETDAPLYCEDSDYAANATELRRIRLRSLGGAAPFTYIDSLHKLEGSCAFSV